MNTFRYLGSPCTLGHFGQVKKGAVLLLTEQEEQSVAGNKDFKQVESKDLTLDELLECQGREMAQADRETLRTTAQRLKADGYPVELHYGQTVEQLRFQVTHALSFAPTAFAGEQRATYDELAKLTDLDLVAAGELAGVAPNMNAHTRWEIVAAIVKAKAEFDAEQADARSQLATLKSRPETSDTVAARKRHQETLAKVWPLANRTQPPEKTAPAAEPAA